MKHPYLGIVVVCGACAALSACGSSKSPAAPAAPTSTGISVTFPAGGTIYIGATAQLQVTETLSDGTTKPVTAAWSSDAPAVATVSQTGIVAPVAAGEATISADANARRGTLRIRVYPNFNGTWVGAETMISCDDSGVFDNLCADPAFYTAGETFRHDSRHTQTDAAATTTVDLGGGMTASGAATVSIPGELQLPTTRVRPEDPDIKVDVENLRFRSDVPSRLTGNYGIRFSSPNIEGSVLIGLRLDNVARTSSTSATAAERYSLSNARGSFIQKVAMAKRASSAAIAEPSRK